MAIFVCDNSLYSAMNSAASIGIWLGLKYPGLCLLATVNIEGDMMFTPSKETLLAWSQHL